MEKETKQNNILVIFLVLIIIILVFIIGYILGGKNNKPERDTTKITEKETNRRKTIDNTNTYNTSYKTTSTRLNNMKITITFIIKITITVMMKIPITVMMKIQYINLMIGKKKC